MWAQVIAPGSNVFDKLCDALYFIVSFPSSFLPCFYLSIVFSLFLSASVHTKWQAQVAVCQFPVCLATVWPIVAPLYQSLVSEGAAFLSLKVAKMLINEY